MGDCFCTLEMLTGFLIIIIVIQVTDVHCRKIRENIKAEKKKSSLTISDSGINNVKVNNSVLFFNIFPMHIHF